jgi:hypothetical protein
MKWKIRVITSEIVKCKIVLSPLNIVDRIVLSLLNRVDKRTCVIVGQNGSIRLSD